MLKPHPRSKRRDALERREALLNAAIACFSEHGFDVPFEQIADRAGVGRGTLYRNFRHRNALAIAILEREIDRLAMVVGHGGSLRDKMRDLVSHGIGPNALFNRIAADIPRSDPEPIDVGPLVRQFEATIAPIVDHAIAAGELRSNVTIMEFSLALRMASSVIHPNLTMEETDQAISKSVDLLLRGLSSTIG